jgi:2-polyprenyl-6-methoxyphenol hydroxylase-like FAD-dependent oxidoreductase
MTMYKAALAQLGPERIRTDHHCVGLEQDDQGVTIAFKSSATGKALGPVRADIAIACDGVNSAVRRIFYPGETVAFAGINTWRGTTRRKPIFDGRTYMRIGSINTGKLVVYPIVDDIDGQGNQLINWMAEIQTGGFAANDWNAPGRLEDFIHLYESWTFDWLDVPAMIRAADAILEYPMVDKDPVGRWTFGRVTLAGDAAHPMYPRGSNGAAQGLIDARTLADELARAGDEPRAALKAYEDTRRPATAKVVETNRTNPPDVICIKVEELTGDKPFVSIDDVISQEDLRALSETYKKVAGFTLADVKRA